jgi:hypothetical protein
MVDIKKSYNQLLMTAVLSIKLKTGQLRRTGHIIRMHDVENKTGVRRTGHGGYLDNGRRE